MKEQRYIDGVSNIASINGNVRMDCFSYTIDPDSDADDPPIDEDLRIVMSPQGFLRAYQAMDRLFQELESRGLVERTGNGVDNGDPSVTVSADADEPASPNFDA